jgi:hypothetical protein
MSTIVLRLFSYLRFCGGGSTAHTLIFLLCKRRSMVSLRLYGRITAFVGAAGRYYYV